MCRLFLLSFALLMFGAAGQSPAEEPNVSKTYVGSVTGILLKVESGKITVRVPVTTQTGVTRRRVGNRTVTVPTYTTKQVENTYPLSSEVTVTTATGKTGKVEDLQPGGLVRLRGYKVTERKSGQKPATHFEVRRIDIPDAPLKK